MTRYVNHEAVPSLDGAVELEGTPLSLPREGLSLVCVYVNTGPGSEMRVYGFDGGEPDVVSGAGFTAAAVMTSARDLVDFTLPADKRPKKWFLVPDESLDGL